MERKVNVVEDLNGKKTVFIHDILFKGKRAVNWDEVEKYLRQYVGEFYQIEDCNKMIYIGYLFSKSIIKTALSALMSAMLQMDSMVS